MFLFVFGVTIGLIGCGDKTAQSKKLTKAEWRAKLASNYGQVAQLGIIDNLKPAQFKTAMGEPHKTQTVGDQAFWYYECSDGTIQLDLHALNLAAGVMQGTINDY